MKEICLLKQAKKRNIALFVLQNVDHWLPEIPRSTIVDINEKSSESNDLLLEETLRKRVLTRMSNHSEVKKEVTKFRELYSDWNKKLAELLPVLGNKQRQKDEKVKIKRRQEERRRRNVKNGENNPSKDEIVQNENTSSDNENIDSTDDQEKVNTDIPYLGPDENNLEKNEDSNDDILSSNEDDETYENLNESISDVITEMNVDDDSIQNGTDNLEEQAQKVSVPVENCMKQSGQCFEKEEGEMVITRLDSSHPLFEGEKPLQTNPNTDKIPEKVYDSFFLGGVSDSQSESEDEITAPKTNKPNERTKKIKRNEFSHGGNSKGAQFANNRRERREILRKGQSYNSFRGQENPSGRDWTGKRGGKSINPKQNSESKHNLIKGTGVRPESIRGANRAPARNNGQRISTVDSIHPSWAAKRKLSAISNIDLNIKGKKITFDEGGLEEKHNFQDKYKPTGKRDVTAKNKPLSEFKSLHPSWAAKKDQIGIKQFTGKKTVFGEDD